MGRAGKLDLADEPVEQFALGDSLSGLREGHLHQLPSSCCVAGGVAAPIASQQERNECGEARGGRGGEGEGEGRRSEAAREVGGGVGEGREERSARGGAEEVGASEASPRHFRFRDC